MSIAEQVLQLKSDFDAVYNAGKQAEYDAFWNAYQQNGNRTDYTYSFAGVAWNKDTFYPKHNLTMRNCHSAFNYCKFSGSLKERLEQLGITMTFPNAQPITSLFNNAAGITELGVIDFSTVQHTNPTGVFQYMKALHTIEKLILPPTIAYYDSWFRGDTALENLTIEGVITNNISFSDCTKLTRESLMSIIDALQNQLYVWTKTTEVFEPIENGEFEVCDAVASAIPGSYPGKVITTTGEKVYYAFSANADYTNVKTGMVCLVDDVYYVVDYQDNPNTYTLSLGATNIAKLEDWEIAEITNDMGWTVV